MKWRVNLMRRKDAQKLRANDLNTSQPQQTPRKEVPNSISLVAPESKEVNTPLIYLAK